MNKLFSILLLVFFPFFGKGQSKPNIVLIVSDDHGTDALGCYGNPVIKTPALDALAKEGTLFTHAFCTAPSCSPSRSVILTGRHNHNNGMYGLEHSFHHFSSFDNVISLPVLLADNNFRTARVGKFHIAPEDVYKFEKVFSSGVANQPDSVSLGRSPVEMAEFCRNFLNEKSEKPFFLYYATDDPHRSNIYLPDGTISFNTFPEPNPFGNQKNGVPGVREITYFGEEVIVPSFLPDTKECRAEMAQYYRSVSRLDQGIGRLIEILKLSGHYENTLIIYISDNGVAFPGAKTTLYEPGIRLPCIVKAPGQKKGLVQNGLVSWTDITPTILDYAQAAVDETMFHGRSFKELVESKDGTGWDEVFASHSLHEVTMYYPMRMVRNERYKLIYNIAHPLPFPFALDLRQSPTWISTENSEYYGKRKKEQFIHRSKFELYDLVEDPDELINLSGNPNYASILETLKSKIKDFQKRTGDPWVSIWENDRSDTRISETGITLAQTPLWQGIERIVISSDGNEHDHDDWAATPLSLALLSAAGLQEYLTLYIYSDHIWGSNQEHPTSISGLNAYQHMRESALTGSKMFGFDKTNFICAVDNAEMALNALIHPMPE